MFDEDDLIDYFFVIPHIPIRMTDGMVVNELSVFHDQTIKKSNQPGPPAVNMVQLTDSDGASLRETIAPFHVDINNI